MQKKKKLKKKYNELTPRGPPIITLLLMASTKTCVENEVKNFPSKAI